jgi:hypothetical protein
MPWCCCCCCVGGGILQAQRLARLSAWEPLQPAKGSTPFFLASLDSAFLDPRPGFWGTGSLERRQRVAFGGKKHCWRQQGMRLLGPAAQEHLWPV